MTNKNNDPIKIRQFTPPQLKFFNPENEFLGYINNQVENLQVRTDIVEQQLSGYYFMYGSIKIDINPDGSVENWPYDLYADSLNYARKIMQLNRLREQGPNIE